MIQQIFKVVYKKSSKISLILLPWPICGLNIENNLDLCFQISSQMTSKSKTPPSPSLGYKLFHETLLKIFSTHYFVGSSKLILS